MKPSLQLKVSQQLTMTPQLQQAIQLLQLSATELETAITDELTNNPLLEEELTTINKLPNYSNTNNFDIINTQSKEQTLQDHLIWQLEPHSFNAHERDIAMVIIDAIADSGYLTAELNEIQESLPNATIQQITRVLHKIQQFDPIGVAARNLAECLTIQLQTLLKNNNLKTKLASLLNEHLAILEKKDYVSIKKILKLTDDELQEALTLLTQLNPRPGNKFSLTKAEYVYPDLIVKKHLDTWLVQLSDNRMNLRINYSYLDLCKQRTTREYKFIQDRLNEAKWFIKSIKHRNNTLLAVAKCIMRKQNMFLEHGPRAMQPLTLNDIALETGLHESTISRATCNKYIYTPQGIHPLKYFFSSHVYDNTGKQQSATSIKTKIKELIKNEDPLSPLSDHKIVHALHQQDIAIARRTVAKYREMMAIPSSCNRKVLISKE